MADNDDDINRGTMKPLEQDYEPPDAPADDQIDDIDDDPLERHRKQLDSTHPDTDAEVDEDEWYNEGLAEAAGSSEPMEENQVIGYHPDPKEEHPDD